MALIDMTGWIMREHGVENSILTVIERDKNKKDTKHTWWTVKCDCGTIFSARSDALRNGITNNCGCLTRKKLSKNCIDMTGWIMKDHEVLDSKLTVLERVSEYDNPSNHTGARWKVKCECGNIFIARGDIIRNGEVKSCGCLQKDSHYYIDMTNWIMKEHGVPDSMLTVLSLDHRDGLNIYWKVRCDCGTEKIIRGPEIRSGRIKSCGCKKYLTIGEKYNKLTVIDNFNNGKYKCQCECGTVVYVRGRDLRSGNTKSCGCLKSTGEYFINKVLQENNVSYIHDSEYFKDLINDNNNVLRYDFIILENNIPKRLIEFDGPQHQNPSTLFGEEEFYRLQKADYIKNQYALSNNIPLVRIPYTELNNISYELLFGDKYLIKENSYETIS